MRSTRGTHSTAPPGTQTHSNQCTLIKHKHPSERKPPQSLQIRVRDLLWPSSWLLFLDIATLGKVWHHWQQEVTAGSVMDSSCSTDSHFHRGQDYEKRDGEGEGASPTERARHACQTLRQHRLIQTLKTLPWRQCSHSTEGQTKALRTQRSVPKPKPMALQN